MLAARVCDTARIPSNDARRVNAESTRRARARPARRRRRARSSHRPQRRHRCCAPARARRSRVPARGPSRRAPPSVEPRDPCRVARSTQLGPGVVECERPAEPLTSKLHILHGVDRTHHRPRAPFGISVGSTRSSRCGIRRRRWAPRWDHPTPRRGRPHRCHRHRRRHPARRRTGHCQGATRAHDRRGRGPPESDRPRRSPAPRPRWQRGRVW